MLSVVIPVKPGTYLQKTIDDLLAKATGMIEVIAVFDGCDLELTPDPRVRIIKFIESRGMRAAINAGVAIATGEFIMKTDDHCMFGEGFDTILARDCEKNMVVIPRRFRLDPDKWVLKEMHKPPVDYMYLGSDLKGKIWQERANQRKEIMVDDTMSMQGSCWFMPRDYFYELELMDEEHYGIFSQESQEICFKAWLSGGRVAVNKNTWYAHWHKDKVSGRGYVLKKSDMEIGTNYAENWRDKKKVWHKQKHDLNWLIRKFSPVPEWS